MPTAMVTRNSAETVAHLHAALWEPAGLVAFAPAISRDDDLPPKPDPAALGRIASLGRVERERERQSREEKTVPETYSRAARVVVRRRRRGAFRSGRSC